MPPSRFQHLHRAAIRSGSWPAVSDASPPRSTRRSGTSASALVRASTSAIRCSASASTSCTASARQRHHHRRRGAAGGEAALNVRGRAGSWIDGISFLCGKQHPERLVGRGRDLCARRGMGPRRRKTTMRPGPEAIMGDVTSTRRWEALRRLGRKHCATARGRPNPRCGFASSPMSAMRLSRIPNASHPPCASVTDGVPSHHPIG